MLTPKFFSENLFDDFFYFPEMEHMEKNPEKTLCGRRAANVMKCDVKETDDHYEMIVDLPGFTRDEISAQVHSGYLTISAAKGVDKDEQNKSGGRYLRRERYAGACQRSFYIGEKIYLEDIKAKFENGILSLEIPKRHALREPQNHRIQIE